MIEGRLEGPLVERGSLLEEKKDCVVFLLSPPEMAATQGNIHLKTNRTFDVNMRVCGVKLARGH